MARTCGGDGSGVGAVTNSGGSVGQNAPSRNPYSPRYRMKDAPSFEPDANVHPDSSGRPFDSQGIPIGANGLRPNEYWNYEQKKIVGPYGNPNTWYKPENFVPAFRGGEQYGNQTHQYDMQQIAVEAEKAVQTQIQSIDITTLGFNPM